MIAKIFPAPNRDLAAILGILLGLVIFFHVAAAVKGHGRYRDQHLGTALHYAATKFDLPHTIIVGFNATETPTIQELPVWQMIAGVAFKFLGAWWGWANLISLILFLNCLFPLFQIVKKFHGGRTAWWSLIFFLSQALIFLYAGEAGTDGFCLSVSIWFWFACVQLLDRPFKWFLPAAALGTLTAVSKMPFFMVIGLASFFLLLKERGFKLRDLAALAGVGLVSAIIFLGWTHYTDVAQKNAELPFENLTLKNPEMVFWYFGDWHYRLNPANWVKAAWRFANITFGSFTLIGLFVFAFASRRMHPLAKLFFLAGILTTLVFTHLILHHYNYLMIFSPAVAILCATAMAELENFLAARGLDFRRTTCVAAAIIFAALFQGLMMMRAFSFDNFPAQTSAAIHDHTAAGDKLVVVNGGWGGEELIRAGRNGLSMWNADAFDDAKKYARLKELGFTKLVILSESPYQNAIKIVNPGQTGISRVMAKTFVTIRVEKWPLIFASDDLIIMEIP